MIHGNIFSLSCEIYLFQDAREPVSLAVIVTNLVPITVKTTRVTYRTERASCVNLDGLG